MGTILWLFVFLHQHSAIWEFTSVMWWIALARTDMDVLIAQLSLVNVLVLDNLCEYRHESYIYKN